MLWKRNSRAAGAAFVGGAFALGLTGNASAQTATEACADLGLPHPVYGAGGSAITADIQKVAAALAGLQQNPITILYSDPSACTGFKGFIDKKVTRDFTYWLPDGTPKSCKAPTAGQEVAFAHMGNPGSDCTGITVPSDVKDFAAPVQTLNIIVGPNNDDDSISAEALYFIYGFGTAGAVTPWTNTAHIAKRTPTSFVHLFLSSVIGVPPASFKGDVELTTNPATIDAVKDFSVANKNDGIGYVSGSAADKARGQVKTLAFKDKDQSCAYYPDSTATANDKANVINGQYALWTAGHWYTRVNASGDIIDQDVKNLIDWYNGTAFAPEGVEVLGLAIDAGDIPLCAMHVKREGLTGAISSVAPPNPCTHYFEKRATGNTTGKACTSDDACKDVDGFPKCRYGYCEAN